MASKVDIKAPLESSSELNLRGRAQKIRGKEAASPIYIAECIENLQDAVTKIQRALRQKPAVGTIVIDSASILNLIVGGPDTPGQLTIYSGPPTYTRIGWFGTDDSGIAVNISTVNAGAVATATPHGLVVGDIVLIEDAGDLAHNGHWEVQTVADTTHYTIGPTPPGGSGSGGTSTLQFAGGWMRQFAIGGTGFGDAPFFATPQGEVIIGRNGSVVIQDSTQVNKGFIGVETESPKSVSGTANNGGLVRLTVTAHGYESGDTVLAGTTGYAITVIDANTIDLIDSVFGSFTPVATVTRYFAGVWSEQLAAGGTGFADAKFRAKADGSVRVGDPNSSHFEVFPDGSILIGDPTGARLEVDAGTGEMSLTDATLSLNTNGVTTTINNESFTIPGLSSVAGLKILRNSDSSYSLQTPQNFIIYNAATDTMDIMLGWFDFGSGPELAFSTTGIIAGDSLFVVNPVAISVGGTGSGTAGGARTNLDVYSKAEVDALIPDVTDYYTKSEIDAMLGSLSYASSTHTHSISDTTGAASAGTAHNHPFSGGTSTPIG